MRRGGDQRDPGSPLGGGGRQRVAHLAAGVVADEAHGVDRLPSASGRNHHCASGQVVAPAGRLGQCVKQALARGQTSGSGVAAGQVPRLGLHHEGAASPNPREVFLDLRLGPHGVVHGWRQHQRAARGQHGGAHDVVGAALGELGDGVGGGRRQQQQLRPVAQLDVRLGFGARRPEVDEHRVAGDPAEGGRAYEAASGGRHGHPHGAARLGHGGGQVGQLVGGDAARHQQPYAEAADLAREAHRLERHLSRISSTSPAARSASSFTTT